MPDDEKVFESAYTETRKDVYFDCGVCVDSEVNPGSTEIGREVHEYDLEEHTASHAHFVCMILHLMHRDSDVARAELLERWHEKMPALRAQWRLYCKRRRYVLEMAGVTKEMLLPSKQGSLQWLLMKEVRARPQDNKAAFVARVAFYLVQTDLI